MSYRDPIFDPIDDRDQRELEEQRNKARAKQLAELRQARAKRKAEGK